jgi:hypothetical protein
MAPVSTGYSKRGSTTYVDVTLDESETSTDKERKRSKS